MQSSTSPDTAYKWHSPKKAGILLQRYIAVELTSVQTKEEVLIRAPAHGAAVTIIHSSAPHLRQQFRAIIVRAPFSESVTLSNNIEFQAACLSEKSFEIEHKHKAFMRQNNL